MSNLPADASSYDAIYQDGGWQNVYDLHYRYSFYYPLFSRIIEEVKGRSCSKVLEVGCGVGQLAHMLVEQTSAEYRGFDFSSIAIQKAVQRLGRKELFRISDAHANSSYSWEYDTIICTEVLEHIEQDVSVVRLWKEGCLCICSVPNFDADNHVRYFGSENQVRQRYGNLINIETVIRVKRPSLADLSWRNYIRHLRWNRYQPKQIWRILGFEKFDKAGGWFVFVGRRKAQT